MSDIVGYSMVALLANAMTAAAAMCLTVIMIWWLLRLARRRLDVLIELQKDNRAVAIVMAAVLIAVALVAGNAFGGDADIPGNRGQTQFSDCSDTGQHQFQGENSGLSPISLPVFPDKYDRYFKKYGRRFFARAVDWRWFKAQGIAESSLNPGAISPAGARGLMQIMPGTSRELAGRLRIRDLPMQPRIAILMGIAYDRQLWAMWMRATARHRLQLMFASYNAGPGNIRRAERLAPCRNNWGCTMLVLQDVTGRHARETVRYVYRIERIKKRL